MFIISRYWYPRVLCRFSWLYKRDSLINLSNFELQLITSETQFCWKHWAFARKLFLSSYPLENFSKAWKYWKFKKSKIPKMTSLSLNEFWKYVINLVIVYVWLRFKKTRGRFSVNRKQSQTCELLEVSSYDLLLGSNPAGLLLDLWLYWLGHWVYYRRIPS